MNKRLRIHMTILGVALIPFATHIYGQPGAPATKFQTVKVKDDLYVFNNPGAPGNITAYVTNEGVILIDAKNPTDYDGIVAAVKAVTNQPIKYLVNTHHHNDHTGSNPQLQKAGAVVIASENARQNMIDSNFSGQPTVTFESRSNVILGGKKVELYYFGRGHTNGDIVAYFPADRAVATGDLYVTGKGTPELVDYAAGGSAKEWPKSVDGILTLDFDIAIPGHGVVADKADVRRLRDLSVKLKDRVHELMVQKASREEIEKVMRNEFGWGDLHVNRGLTGIMAEMRQMP